MESSKIISKKILSNHNGWRAVYHMESKKIYYYHPETKTGQFHPPNLNTTNNNQYQLYTTKAKANTNNL